VLTDIGNGTFAGCSSLTSLTLPASLKSIGDSAFAGCSGLDTVTLLPKTPPTLGDSAFAGVPLDCAFLCDKNLRRKYWEDTAWRDPYFADPKYPFSFDAPDAAPAPSALDAPREVTGFRGAAGPALTIPDPVIHEGGYYPLTSIAARAFRGSAVLSSLTLPAGITAIGDSASKIAAASPP
jgi:hypothetical protein